MYLYHYYRLKTLETKGILTTALLFKSERSGNSFISHYNVKINGSYQQIKIVGLKVDDFYMDKCLIYQYLESEPKAGEIHVIDVSCDLDSATLQNKYQYLTKKWYRW